MTQIEPPADLSRAERKAFRNLAKRLVVRGIDPVSRVGLVEDFVRLEGRLADLRAAEKQSDSGSTLATSRAVNMATAERRRLHDAIFRGAKKPDSKPTPIEQAAAAGANEADETWRAHYAGKGLRSNGDAVMQARVDAWMREGFAIRERYGDPSWGALLYRTAAEEIGVSRLVEKYRPRSIPGNELQELYAEIGLQPPGPRHHADKLGPTSGD
jgi:hypothetical protein